MSATKSECLHDTFQAMVSVARLAEVEGGPCTHFAAEVRIHCSSCGLPFSFLGPEYGLLRTRPAVSPDRTELRIPITPGPTPLPAGGTMRFEV